MGAQPHQLGGGEAGHRLDAGDRGEAAASLAEFARLGEGAAVVMEDRRPQRPIVGAEQHRAVHLAGEADGADRGVGLGRGVPEVAERLEHRVHPDVGVLFRPQRMRIVGAIGARRRSDHPSPRFHQHGLEAGRPAIHAECDHGATVAEFAASTSGATPRRSRHGEQSEAIQTSGLRRSLVGSRRCRSR